MKWPADPGLLTETKLFSLPEQPHPGSAPGRSHSWNFFTLPEPAPSSWVHQLPFFPGDPSIVGTGNWGEPLLCKEGAEHNTGLKGSCPLPKMLSSANGPQAEGGREAAAPSKEAIPHC